MVRGWKNISIVRRLYIVIGIMAFLIIGELVTLRFAMRQLSAARAFVGGESLWSKSQKNAVLSLQRYGLSGDPKEYKAFIDYLKVPQGDHMARTELLKSDGDDNVIRAGFLQGQIQGDDIGPIISLLRNFYKVSYLTEAISIWGQGDELLLELERAGVQYHAAVEAHKGSEAQKIFENIRAINDKLTILEENFSYVLGQGCRWLEHMVLFLLTLAVLTVETVGITLALITTRGLSRGLSELTRVAQSIGEGRHEERADVTASDEVGKLGQVINVMAGMLHRNYQVLDERVRERTSELKRMAVENEGLYQLSRAAVESRDEMLSIASHELRTPLTSLFLQLQILADEVAQGYQQSHFDKITSMVQMSLKQTRRVTRLLDDLLDLTRIRVGKFELNKEDCDLVDLVGDVTNQMKAEASGSGSVISFHADGGPVKGNFDVARVGQIVTNLVSNAVKYGRGNPIDVFVKRGDKCAIIQVSDHGVGIGPESREKVFDRFERGYHQNSQIAGSGLGLYITRKIVQAHGGSISFESELNKGSTFEVRLTAEPPSALIAGK